MSFDQKTSIVKHSDWLKWVFHSSTQFRVHETSRSHHHILPLRFPFKTNFWVYFRRSHNFQVFPGVFIPRTMVTQWTKSKKTTVVCFLTSSRISSTRPFGDQSHRISITCGWRSDTSVTTCCSSRYPFMIRWNPFCCTQYCTRPLCSILYLCITWISLLEFLLKKELWDRGTFSRETRFVPLWISCPFRKKYAIKKDYWNE